MTCFDGDMGITYKELRIATDNFSLEKRIGQGRFGSVYEGRLNDGTLVAIEVLSDPSEQVVLEFLNVIEVLSGIEHENLVKLYDSCTEGDHKMLVYGYIEYNSLAQTLLSAHNNELLFPWKIRSQICIGVAQGLAFLHEEAEPRIVHRNVKASNVLLDRNFTPKISNFALARLFPNPMTHINICVAGTPGYMDPDYALTGTLTSKSDVYSYGILLLEIVSGTRNGDMRSPAEAQNLLARAWALYEEDELFLLVDKALGAGSIPDEACKYLKIGLLCAQERAKERPTMSVVAKMLKGEIDVDKMKMPKPGKLMALFTQKSSNHEPHASLLGSCFCFGPITN